MRALRARKKVQERKGGKEGRREGGKKEEGGREGRRKKKERKERWATDNVELLFRPFEASEWPRRNL